MGRIYESIRKDIEKLRQIDEALKNHQPVSMDQILDTAIALEKVQYVLTYTEHEEPALLQGTVFLPQGDMVNFNVPNNFEDMVDEWEDALGEERTNEAIRHLDLQTKEEAYVPEITPHNPQGYFEYVTGTMNRVANVSALGHFGISKEGVGALAVSAQQEFSKVASKQNFAYNPNSNDRVYDFLRDPVTYVVNGNRAQMRLEDKDDRDNYYDAMQQETEQILANMPNNNFQSASQDLGNNYPVARAMDPLLKAPWKVKDVATGIKESVEKYRAEKAKAKNAPSMGKFLSDAKDKTADIVLDHAITLGDDEDSKFIQSFIQDPVAAMEKHYSDLAQDGRGRALGNYQSKARDMAAERANYQQAREGKVDRYAALEARRKEHFETFFNEHNPNFDPARFKSRFAGSTFERFLGRTSKEWTDLSNYVDSWKNIGGNRDLDKAADLACKYLKHKFPDVDPKDVTPEMVAGLRGAGKDRGAFCLTLVQGQLDSKEEMNQHIYDEANAAFDGYETRLHRGENFQDVLANDINAEHRDIVVHQTADTEIYTNLIVQHENELE